MLSFIFLQDRKARYSTTSCDDVTRDYLIILDMLLCSQEVILTLLKAGMDLKQTQIQNLFFYFNEIIDFSVQQHAL